MGQVGTVIRGLPELRAALLELPKNLQQNALRQAVLEAAKLIAERVHILAPYRTGYIGPKHAQKYPAGTLIKSIRGRRRRGGKGFVQAEVDMVFYARFIEKGWTAKTKTGTVHIPGRPFILPAYLATRDRAIERIKQVIRREVLEQPRRAKNRAVSQVKDLLGDALTGGE